MLEDDSGRIRLVGDLLKSVLLVTGCIIAVMGTENINGELEVIDIKFPDLAPQPERWQLTKPAASSNGGTKVKKEEEDVDMANSQTGGGIQGLAKEVLHQQVELHGIARVGSREVEARHDGYFFPPLAAAAAQEDLS